MVKRTVFGTCIEWAGLSLWHVFKSERLLSQIFSLFSWFFPEWNLLSKDNKQGAPCFKKIKIKKSPRHKNLETAHFSGLRWWREKCSTLLPLAATGVLASCIVVHATAQEAHRLSIGQAPRYKWSAAVERTESSLKASAAVIWSIFVQYEARPIYFILWYHFHILQQALLVAKNLKTQKCMLLKTVDDEHIFCTKCLSSFIIVGVLVVSTRIWKVEDTNQLKMN